MLSMIKKHWPVSLFVIAFIFMMIALPVTTVTLIHYYSTEQIIAIFGHIAEVGIYFVVFGLLLVFIHDIRRSIRKN